MKRIAKIVAAASAIVALAAGAASAGTYTFNYGWEDGGTILGAYSSSPMTGVNVTSPVNAGTHSLRLTKTTSGTDQAYVAWIQNLQAGDVVTASFWVHDTTPSSSPSGRIWGGYNDGADVNTYNGSAGGSDTYSGSDVWSQLSYSWTIASGHTGLVVQARGYGSAGSQIWLDDLSLAISTNQVATVHTPGETSTTAVPEPAGLVAMLSGLIGLVGTFKRVSK